MDLSLSDNNLFSKKNIITYLILAIIILGIPIGVKLVQQQTQLRSKAAGDEIKFSGDGVKCDPNAASNEVGCSTTNPTVRVQITSPFGAPLP